MTNKNRGVFNKNTKKNCVKVLNLGGVWVKVIFFVESVFIFERLNNNILRVSVLTLLQIKLDLNVNLFCNQYKLFD
ncbi:hypothetical protein [Marinifilum sp. D714]|uniref:hypothetical protein n=1 Tax=Marinifilum sp. D714 TaxID=2937523 RepID=UPI0027C2C3D6|nr:hypothetical protein [Marinifilum sp. D714]MDQ2178514.1 hypothetical protein [Marinifilum sp. D714]